MRNSQITVYAIEKNNILIEIFHEQNFMFCRMRIFDFQSSQSPLIEKERIFDELDQQLQAQFGDVTNLMQSVLSRNEIDYGGIYVLSPNNKWIYLQLKPKSISREIQIELLDEALRKLKNQKFIISDVLQSEIDNFLQKKSNLFKKQKKKEGKQRIDNLERLFVISLNGKGLTCKKQKLKQWFNSKGVKLLIVKMKKGQDGKLPIIKLSIQDYEKIKGQIFEGQPVQLCEYLMQQIHS